MSKLTENIVSAGYSVKKEITITVIIDVVLAVATALGFLFTSNFIILVVGASLIAIFTYLYLSRFSSILKEQETDNIKNFVMIFTFFKIYLKNGYNIYTALKAIEPFANPFVLEKLSMLTYEMDEDKSVKPFVKFARNFNMLLIEQLMISIYQMIDAGSNESYLLQFEILFNKLSEENYQNEFQKKEKKLLFVTYFPLVGSALLIVMITLGVVAVIGEMVNGL